MPRPPRKSVLIIEGARSGGRPRGEFRRLQNLARFNARAYRFDWLRDDPARGGLFLWEKICRLLTVGLPKAVIFFGPAAVLRYAAHVREFIPLPLFFFPDARAYPGGGPESDPPGYWAWSSRPYGLIDRFLMPQPSYEPALRPLLQGLPMRTERVGSGQFDLEDCIRRVAESRRAARCSRLLLAPHGHSLPHSLAEGSDGSIFEYDPRKTGYAEALNAGLARCSGPYVLVTEPEDRLSPNGSEHLLACAETQEDCAAFSTVVRRPKRSPARRRMWVESEVWALRREGVFRPLQYFGGGCFLLRSSAVERAGLLDERFRTRLYALADYGLRLRQEGYRLGRAIRVLTHRPPRAEPVWDQAHLSDRRLLWEKWCESPFLLQ